VNLIGFSMGGMNSRAYLETTLYGNDVNRVIILGTPQAGVEVWKPILFQQILEKFDQPSAIELSPEYARLIVDTTRAPYSLVPYDLLIGDARGQNGLDFLQDIPASDALISVASALALNTPNVRKHVNADLHDWGPEPVPFKLTGYLYPRDTWERYLRNALRNDDTLPLGSEVQPATPFPVPVTPDLPVSNHTPVVTRELASGMSVTRTLELDPNRSARFVAYYPGGKVDFSLVAPDGSTFESDELPSEDAQGVLSLSTDIAAFSGFVVREAQPGEWKLVLERTDRGEQPIPVSTYAELTAPVHLNTLARWDTLAVGATNTITASLRTTSGATFPAAKVMARVAQPGPRAGEPYTFAELELFDDGAHHDGAAKDGFFANDYTPTRAGWHPFFITAESDGFSRQSEGLFAVSANDAGFAAGALLTRTSGRRLLEVGIETRRAGSFAISVSFRSKANGDVIARIAHPLLLQPGANRAGIFVDTVPLPAGEYELDLILLDASWAAIELDRAAAAVTLTVP
jgi:hypothetical protein